MAATELMERTELQPQKAMLELSETCPPRTALSTNPAQPTQPAQRWTINSSSKSADRNAANQPTSRSSRPIKPTRPVNQAGQPSRSLASPSLRFSQLFHTPFPHTQRFF
jgi:hypothetical protein